ncbi:hypothetical protein U1Q18_022849 [Sarracenia purpurea var. burkii]
MATPKLLLSKLPRRRPSTLTAISSPSYSSSSHFSISSSHSVLAQSINLTTPKRIFCLPPLTVHKLAVYYSFFCFRSLSTRDSEYGGGQSLDLATQSEDFSGLGFGAAEADGDGSEVSEALISAAVNGGTGGDGESILPVRAVISLLDGYHDFTGLPW